MRRLERGELSTFVKLCDMSAARQGFKSRDLAYYERLFDTFGDLIEFKVVETHFDEYLDTLQSKLNAASKDKRNLERLLQRAQQQPEGTAKKGASDPATLEKRIATADKKIAALERPSAKSMASSPRTARSFRWKPVSTSGIRTRSSACPAARTIVSWITTRLP